MRASQIDRLDVYKGEFRAGTLEQTLGGSIFRYGDEFLANSTQGLAFRMPLSQPHYETKGVNLSPFFAGLLPEGLRLNAVIRGIKTSADDLLSILAAVGSDPIGDVSVIPNGQDRADKIPTVDLSKAGELDFKLLFKDAITPGTASREFSLPGVQDKLSAAVISMPIRGRTAAESYILKLIPEHLPRIVQNEHFFLRLASACRIDAAKAKLVEDGAGNVGLLVTRFDRVGQGRIQQEDACQFLDRYPADKYRISAKEVIVGLQEFATSPKQATYEFLRRFAFNYLIGNGDFHAKNLSLRVSPKTGLVELTPMYDAPTTLCYGDLDQTMPMHLDGKADRFRVADIVAFGERHEVPAPALTKACVDLATRIAPWLPRLAEIGFGEKETGRLRKQIEDRIARFAG